jgi:hypothetical protein
MHVPRSRRNQYTFHIFPVEFKQELIYNNFMEPGTFSKISDTSPKAEEVQIALLRRLTPAQRLAKTFSLSHEVVQLSKRAIRRQNPGLSESELKILYLRHFYGPELAHKYKEYLEKNSNNGIR